MRMCGTDPSLFNHEHLMTKKTSWRLMAGLLLAVAAVAGLLTVRHYQQLAQQEQNLFDAMSVQKSQAQRDSEVAEAKRKIAADIAAAHQGLGPAETNGTSAP